MDFKNHLLFSVILITIHHLLCYLIKTHIAPMLKDSNDDKINALKKYCNSVIENKMQSSGLLLVSIIISSNIMQSVSAIIKQCSDGQPKVDGKGVDLVKMFANM